MKNCCLLLALVLLVLCGCAPPAIKSPGDLAIERWQGKPIARVIQSWGPPSEQLEVADGQVYSWLASAYQPSGIPANMAPGTTHAYRSQAELVCRGVFTVDARGLVTHAQWQGYECWALP